jgi:4,4'-diaponeurosporenoate glycosyltransferase
MVRIMEPSVSVIIPARDEEHNLRRTLTHELDGVEVIVANDGSTDKTAEVARSRGARVLDVPPLPRGWRGKTWACWNGAHAAAGETLVFIDADTRFEPGGLRRLLELHRELGGMVSLEPYHRVVRPYEQLSAVFNLVRVLGVGKKGAFGPCVATSREDYLRVGGHAHPAVRGQVLENLELGGIYREHGVPVNGYLGRGMVSTRMYPQGPGELVEGWSKALAQGAGASSGLTVLIVVLGISAGLLSAGWLLAWPSLWSLAAYAACGAALHLALRRLGSFSWVTSMVYPVPLLAFIGISLRSFYLVRVRGQVTWKGRQVDVASTRGGG